MEFWGDLVWDYEEPVWVRDGCYGFEESADEEYCADVGYEVADGFVVS